VCDISPKILLLSESRTIENMSDSELKLNNYKIFRCDAANRHTGGVVIYIHESVSAHVVYKHDIKSIWALAISVTRGFCNDCFCVVYRGHQSSVDDFREFFSTLCESLSEINSNCHIVGDMNFDFTKDKFSKELKNIARSYNFKQLVTQPTRVTNDSSSLIDWFFTNRKNASCNVEINNQISDHYSLSVNFKPKNKSQKCTKIIKTWKNYSLDKLLQLINQFPWNSYSDCIDINEKTSFLFDNLELAVDSLVRVKKVKVHNNSYKWFNSDLQSLKNSRDNAHGKWKSDKNEFNWNCYKKNRNDYKNALQKAESNYISTQLSNFSDNPKKMWKILKSLYSDDHEKIIDTIKFDDGVETEPNVIAERLNDYFIRSVINLAEKIPKIDCDVSERINVNCCFSFKMISVNELRFFVKQVEKKSFINNINGRVLNDAMCHNSFAQCFCDIINYSFMSATFPDSLKTSIIVPLQKVKNTINYDELRPINRLKVEENIIERVVKCQTVDSFEQNNLFICEQSGFRKKHSCETALNSVIYEWRNSLESRFNVIAVFIDLKRAFETIDRNFLLSKLHCYGLDNFAVKWFRDYLSGRHQVTLLNEFFSNEQLVDIGIPQGSVLSCILFIIFINDLKSALSFSNISLFADDALIQISCGDLGEGLHKMNDDLDNVFKYLCASRLSLNISKTKFMIISNKTVSEDIQLSINGEQLERVTEYKYLGIILDSKLSFNPLTDDLCKKLNKKFAIFKRCEKKLDNRGKITFFKSLVQSQIDSCCTLLFLLNQSQLSRLQLVQNRFARVILRVDSRTSVKLMHEQLKWMTVKQRISFNVLKFLHKIEAGNAPDYLSKLVRYMGDSSGRVTRQRNQIAPVWSDKKSIFHNGIQMYNDCKAKYLRKKPTCSLKSYFMSYANENY
jgi:hypothetical protein